MRYSALATVLIGLSALCWTGCSTTRRATERLTVQGSAFRVEQARDSLREEILQNLNENLSEHEIITEKMICNDSVLVERVTDRTRTRQSGAELRVKNEELRVVTVRDTVYVERTDSVDVKTNTNVSNPTNGTKGSLTGLVKWLTWLIVALTVLIVVIKIVKN